MITDLELISNRSRVKGFAWKGNIDIKKNATLRAEDAILDFLSKDPHNSFTAEEIIASVDISAGDRAISTTLKKMRESGFIKVTGKGNRGAPFYYSYPSIIVDNELVKLTS